MPALRQFPYPYRHVVTFDSDVDRQAPWHGVAIHRFLNEQLGLNVSDSCWVMAARPGQSSFFIGADLNVRPVPEEDNQTVWRLLLREWHRGNIDHFHSWYDDGTRLLRYPQSDSKVVLPPPPKSVGSAVYRVLRLVMISHSSRDAVTELVLETDAGDKVKYAINGNQCATRITNTKRIAPTIELILGIDEPLLGEAPRSWASIRNIQLNGYDVETVELDNMSRRLVLMQTELMERLNVRPVYVSSHGGFTCAQNFGETQVETQGRFDGLELSVARERIPQADIPGSHAYYADLLTRLGTEVIWPQTWDLWRPYVQFQQEAPPELKEWSKSRLLGGWRTKIALSMTPLDDAYIFGEAMAAHLKDNSGSKFSKIFDECHGKVGLKGKVVPGHGSMLPLLLQVSFQAIQNSRTTEHIWYTHFGSHRDNRIDEITSKQPFSEFCTSYWRELAMHAHNTDMKKPERVWTPSVGTYFRYKMAMQFLQEAISVDGNHVKIGTRKVSPTGRTVPDLHAGTRDLHGMTIFVDDAEQASLSIDGFDYYSFSKNQADETGRESITILDDHCPTPLLERIPASEIGNLEVFDADFSDLPAPGARGFQLSTTGLDPHLKLSPTSLFLWNTSHLAMRYRIIGDGQLRLTLMMEEGCSIVASEAATLPDNIGSFWLLNSGTGWREHWLPVAHLKVPNTPVSGEAYPVPVGKVKSIEISLINAKLGSRLELDWIKSFRACANAISGNNDLILGGRVIGSEGPVDQAQILARDLEGSEWSAVTDSQGYWLFENMPKNMIFEVSCMLGTSLYHPKSGRYIDLQKNEVEIDFLVGQP